ncbi:MAG: DNA modification methylase, partial [Candidatus Marinimicrobia bacterium]|nr:DNA modification methylase [Candidatus Neomarinimicrobiota bacterium]
KGDRDGNRWFAESPYYIDWSNDSVGWLKGNSGKKGKGMPVVRNPKFFFRAGFCWSDVHTTYLKSRIKLKGVHDVKSMSLFNLSDLISTKYIICIINSSFASEFQQEFYNNTSSFQINDARKIPIIIPSPTQLSQYEDIFDRAYGIKEQQFSEEISKEIAITKLNEIQDELDEMVYALYGVKR